MKKSSDGDAKSVRTILAALGKNTNTWPSGIVARVASTTLDGTLGNAVKKKDDFDMGKLLNTFKGIGMNSGQISI